MPKKQGPPTLNVPPGARAERRRKVADMIALQFTSPKIERALSKEFEVSRRMIRNDIADHMAQLAEIDAQDRPHRKNTMRQTWLDLYPRALNDKDWRAAGMALDRLCKMDGLYEADKVLVTHTHQDARAEIEALDDEARKALRDIVTRVELAKRIREDAAASLH